MCFLEVAVNYCHFCFPDVNECFTMEHNCHINATCNNTIPSFECYCNAGFSGNNGTHCYSKDMMQLYLERLAKVTANFKKWIYFWMHSLILF